MPISNCFWLSPRSLAALVERVLLGLHILIGLHQAPVDGLDLIDGVENLLAERRIDNAAVVQRLVHEALVDPDARALQQMLGDLGLDSRNSIEG